jgi:hypothetical protein
LHFLLDGFVTNHIGNGNKSAREAMVSMLRLIANEEEETLQKIAADYIREIERGENDYIPLFLFQMMV